jgi:hypothetical protein
MRPESCGTGASPAMLASLSTFSKVAVSRLIVLAVAHRETGQALAYIPVAVGLTGVAVMVLHGTRWVIRVIIVVLAGQLGAIAGTTWELSHGIDARKASQLRHLGFDPTAGVVINLIYSSIGFALFCWFAARWLAARRRRHASSRQTETTDETCLIDEPFNDLDPQVLMR